MIRERQQHPGFETLSHVQVMVFPGDGNGMGNDIVLQQAWSWDKND